MQAVSVLQTGLSWKFFLTFAFAVLLHLLIFRVDYSFFDSCN